MSNVEESMEDGRFVLVTDQERAKRWRLSWLPSPVKARVLRKLGAYNLDARGDIGHTNRVGYVGDHGMVLEASQLEKES